MKASSPCVAGVSCDAGTRRATQQQSKTASHERTIRKNNCNLAFLAVFFRSVRCGGRRILGHAVAMRPIAAQSTSTARIRGKCFFASVTVAVGPQRCSRALAGYAVWTTPADDQNVQRKMKLKKEKRNKHHGNMEAGLHRGQLKRTPLGLVPFVGIRFRTNLQQANQGQVRNSTESWATPA